MFDVNETEHQELFYLQINPAAPVAIHIPSALGKLGYFIFVRVPAAAASLLSGVSSRLEVGGLRPDLVTVAPGAGACTPDCLPSTAAGMVWRCLGRASVSRGDGVLEFAQWPAEIPTVDLLLCTWDRFVRTGQADDWIAGQADPQWAPSGVPLGGIGGGRVDLCRDGRFRNFSMNHNQDAPLENPDGVPGAYLALACDGVVTDLATRPIMPGHAACPTLAYTPRFPHATLAAAQIVPGIDVTVTASGPLCPHDLRRAAIPGFLVRWELVNTGATVRTVHCQFGWPNLIGFGGGIANKESSIGFGDGGYRQWEDPTGRDETPFDTAHAVGVRFDGCPAAPYQNAAGAHLLAVAVQDELMTAVRCSDGQGEVSAGVTLPSGGRATVTMALVACMPHCADHGGVERGHYWQNLFPNGEALLTALLAEAEEIFAETGALAALLDASTLPAWLRSRLSNCTYPLVTNSVLYRDGRFSINEGPTEMGACFGTIDQRLAAHPATQLLFPQLNATELGLFARVQGENGGIQHDLGWGELEKTPGEQPWPDLTCSFIIQTARHAWTTGDVAFDTAMWPLARRALLRHVAWAQAGEGVAQVGHGLGTSYDGYHYYGTTGYMATLWLAALAVAEKWARRQGDSELLAQIPAWRAAAVQRLDADLWNGEFYIAYGEKDGTRRETCHAGQLAGQVFAQLIAGQDVLDEAKLLSCITALLARNGDARFTVPPDEVGEDGADMTPFGWLPYVEGFMLTAVACKAPDRLWPLWERMMGAVERDGQTPCDTRLMYRPLGGEPSWGAYYMTAPASWLVYDAALDFAYTPVEGLLRLRVAQPGRYPLVHPRFWGRADITANGQVTLTIERVFGEGPLTLAHLEVPADCAVSLGETPLTRTASAGHYAQYALPHAQRLAPGVTLCWKVTAPVPAGV
ncbi:MAG TPA: GH116 family glycosyl hydrolase [Armatimonadota bacterium]|jgi:hypothetical protein